MTLSGHNIDAIRKLGYSQIEAQFLYLVATHSGYFTRSQFLRFTGQAKGRQVHRFTTKTLERRHARVIEYGRKTYVFNLFSRRIYGAIERENLRNRRRLSNELVHTRLLILDFILGHLDHEYLETEAHKVAYFHRSLGIPFSALPGRIYKGLKSVSTTKRFFVDRSPIFLAPGMGPLSGSSVATFVYCDAAEKDLIGFISHLRNYENLLWRLPAFNFIYASATSERFVRASKFFQSVFGQAGPSLVSEITRYFQVRQLWEGHKTASLTRADRELLRAGDLRYHGELFDSAYRRWSAGTLPEVELASILKSWKPTQTRNFSTCVLPNTYSIFYRRSFSQLRPSLRSRWSP